MAKKPSVISYGAIFTINIDVYFFSKFRPKLPGVVCASFLCSANNFPFGSIRCISFRNCKKIIGAQYLQKQKQQKNVDTSKTIYK